MPSALITGPFAWRDPGEEAVLAALMRGLPGWDPTVASIEPPAASERRSARGLRALTRSLVRADAVIAISRVLGLDPSPGARQASTATLRRTAGLLASARSLGKPVAMIGVGSGRLATRGSRVLARTLVRRSDLLVLRDGASARSLGEAGAPLPFRVGADLAWTSLIDGRRPAPLEPSGAGGSNNGNSNPRGSVTVAIDSRASRVELIQRLAISLGKVAAAGIEVRLQPWMSRPHGFDDVRLAGVLAGMIDEPVRVLNPPSSLHAAAADYRRSAAVIALRYHALIAAASVSAPCLAVVHEPDIGDLASRLGQPSVSSEANPPDMVRAMIDVLDHPPAELAAVEAQISSAEESVRLLRLLLSDGRSPDVSDLDGLQLEPSPAR